MKLQFCQCILITLMVLFALESLFYILKKPQNFTDVIFKLKTQPMLSYVAGYCSALTNMAAHSLYHKTELCIVIFKSNMCVEFSFFQSVKRLEISSFISILVTLKIAVKINFIHYCKIFKQNFSCTHYSIDQSSLAS